VSRLRRVLALTAFAVFGATAACAPKPEAARPTPVALDCAQPFDVMSAKIVTQPRLTPAPKEPGEPYRFYSMEGGGTSYVITEKGAPGHPAILMQVAANGQETTTGCPYGDPKGYQKVLAYIESLKKVTHR
jgi:hypothetical protein